MTRPFRVALIAAGSIILLLLIVVGAGVTIIRSQWFRDQVRNRIVGAMETATGGRVEIASFDFDWHTLTATVRGLTLHGTEPANGPPLLHADDVVVGLKIISLVKRDIDVALLRIDKPQAFLLVAPNGTTNIPNPKVPQKSTKSPVETIVDLAVQRFELNDGSAQVMGAGAQKASTQAYSAKGQNLRALFTFDAAVPRYHGDLAIAPLDLVYGDYRPLQANINATLALEKNKLVLEKSNVSTGDSAIALNGQLANFTAPVLTAEYRAKVSIGQVGSIMKLKTRQSGWLEANGSASYASASDFAISGFVKGYDIDYRAPGIDLRRVRAQAKIDGGPQSVSVNDVRIDALGGEILAKAEIQQFERFKLNGELRHFDVRQVASLATQAKLPYDGIVSGPVFAEGRISELKNARATATARLTLSPASAGVPVRGLIDAKYNGARNTLDLGNSFVALPNTRLEFSGTLGQRLAVHFASSNLNDILPAMQLAAKPGEAAPALPVTVTPQGQLTFDGTVTGKLQDPVLAGHLNGAGFIVQNQTIDLLNADITAASSGATVTNGQLRQKTLSANFSGSVGLHNWSPENNEPLTASLSLKNANLPDLLSLAGQTAMPVTGTLNASANVNGTIGDPLGSADLTLAHGAVEGEPYDQLTAHVTAPARTTQTLTAQLNAGPKQVTLNASYAHGPAAFIPGSVTFHVASNAISMQQVVMLHQREPDVSGIFQVTADGALQITNDAQGKPAIAITKINADASETGLELAGKRLGDLHLTANTVASGGPAPQVAVKLRSNLASADINADGMWTLAGDYPGSAKLQFRNVNLDTVRRLFLTPQQADSIRIGGSIEGTLDVNGPAAKPAEIEANLQVPHLEVHPLAGAVGTPAGIDLSVKNAEPIRVSLKDSVVRVESAHLLAQDSDFSIAGRATLAPHQDLNLRANGHLNLAILHLLSTDIVSSGQVDLDARMRGDFSAPVFNGSLALRNANLSVADLPNGLSNANGTVEFTGNQATIQNLTAESGGGKVTLGGFAAFTAGIVSFRVSANANGVRVRYPQGVSTVADAQLSLVGTTQRSILQGTVTIDRLAFNPKTDLGSLLSATSAPPETPSASTGFTSNLQFDVQIATSPDITFESSLTSSVQADANLRLRGTIQNPVLLGRVNITQGDLTFFGNTYTINQGSVSFFNPVKLEPILNIDFETVAKGVDVTITVSGPISKLNVTYRSDPPLQFSDIVALLATGRVPNDATIAARQPSAPQQSWQEMGASALVGQVIANPVAGRLQRFFGVSQLKIDPTISGITGNPQAKVTLQQQVTPDITFTYITDVANSEEALIRVEWDFSPVWSALATRDENGEFGVEFLYKKRFK